MAEKVDHAVVGICAEHACFGSESRLFGVGEEVACLRQLGDEHGCFLGHVGFTGVRGVNPFVVVLPDVAVEGAVARILPFIHDDGFVGGDFLQVPVAADVCAGAAVGGGDVAFVEEGSVEAAEVAVPLFGGGEFELCLRVVGHYVEVVGAGCSGQCHTGYSCIFI